MIGNAENASIIANMPTVEDEWGDWVGMVPEGFTYLSSGSYRHAFLGPDGVVYKRDLREGDETDSAGNMAEWFVYSKGHTFPEGIRFALTHLWEMERPIIAMEYVADKSPRITPETQRACAEAGIWDVYGANVRTRDGEVILTDFAM